MAGRVVVLAAALLIGLVPTAHANANEGDRPADGPAVPGTLGPRAADPEDRYALAGGCYAIQSVATGGWVHGAAGEWIADAESINVAVPVHFQATDLGRYLLYLPDGRFLAADGATLTSHNGPGAAADWELVEEGESFALRLPSTGRTLTADNRGRLAAAPDADADRATVRFRVTEGCAEFPDIDPGVSGPHLRAETAYEQVEGYIDAHLHLGAFEFLGGRAHCGRPWHRYGVERSLVDCPDHEIADGAGAVLENLLSHGTPVATHDPTGWPTFKDWPAHDSLMHELSYYRWIERAWRGGLRSIVALHVENRVLCEVYPYKKNSCDEMDSVRLQAQRLRELERYIDAQSGGPGEGWFRIVDDPFEAREVMNAGLLAVIPGMEISEPFGCQRFNEQAQCTEADIDRGLDELQDLGIQHVFLVHKFDNALGGTSFDPDTNGVIVNLGNFYGTGRFWAIEQCDPNDTGVHDNDQLLAAPDDLTGPIVGALHDAIPGALPVYPPPHHCNPLGLSSLGEHAVRAAIERDMILDIDHMSVRARQQALDIVEEAGHGGVTSSHSWLTPDAQPRIHALGGVISPSAGGSTEDFVGRWQAALATNEEPFVRGIGFGSDANGLGAQAGPRRGAESNPVTYPFTGLGGAVLDRQVSGQRTFDINTDGVAHYGLYPDWVEDLRIIAGDEIVADLARGSEAYLQMWERAEGIAPPRCLPARDIARLGRGMTPQAVLETLGQPSRRTAEGFVYCAIGGADLTVPFVDGMTTSGRPAAREQPETEREHAASPEPSPSTPVPASTQPTGSVEAAGQPAGTPTQVSSRRNVSPPWWGMAMAMAATAVLAGRRLRSARRT